MQALHTVNKADQHAGSRQPTESTMLIQTWMKKKNEAEYVALVTEYSLNNLKQTPAKGRPDHSHRKTSSDNHYHKWHCHPPPRFRTLGHVQSWKAPKSLSMLKINIYVGSLYIPQVKSPSKIHRTPKAPCKQLADFLNPFHKTQECRNFLILFWSLHCILL